MTGRERAARSAQESVLAVKAADRTAILVRGKDRIVWLNGLVTCDLAKLGPDEGAYGLIVEKKGRIQTDLYILGATAVGPANALALAVPADRREGLLAMLDHYLVMEDAELEVADLVFWQLHGPRSAEVALGLSAPFAGTLRELGAAVAAPAAEGASFEERVVAGVSAIGGAVVDDATWEALRIERGLPRFGVEVDTTLYPQEASLEKLAVSFDKGCYLGQEVVYMLENRGHVKRKLVPLDVEGVAALAQGDAVTTPEGAAVGEVKSSVIGPAGGKPVAIAMVKWAQAKPGTELRVGDRVARVRS